MNDPASPGTVESDWARLASFGSGFEADVARSILEEAGILVQIRGHTVGIYGPSFLGTVIGGVDLYVPTTDLELAREVLA